MAFLKGHGRDYLGRSHADILGWGDALLEDVHDYIQWLFPLCEPSIAVPSAPVLDPALLPALRADASVQVNLAAAAQRMATFYDRTEHWLASHDHNHLRITRILKTLRMLAGRETAQAFLEARLARIAETSALVSATSLRFWREAVGEAP